MKKLYEKITMNFINWNLISLFTGNILLIFLYSLIKEEHFFIWLFVLFFVITFTTSLACRLIYITLIDSFKDTLENIILNKFIEDKIVEVNMKVKVPKELIIKQTKIK